MGDFWANNTPPKYDDKGCENCIRLKKIANSQQEAIREISKERNIYRRKYERLKKSGK